MATRISLRQLEYCVAVSECGSVAEAAAHVHVSPSSVSAAVAHVERELQVQLFIRHHAQGLSLTPAGRHVLREARQIIDMSMGLYAVAANADQAMSGPLRVGCFTTFAPMIVPELCQGFARAHPAVQISTIEDHQEGLLDKLRYAEIDIAITYDLDIGDADIQFEKLASLPPHVIMGEGHPLAQREAVTLEELAQHPMVLLDLPQSREYFLSLFHKVGCAPLVTARSHSPDVVRSLVANHIGYSVVNVRPRSSLALDGRPVVSVPLLGEHRPMLLGLAWPRSRKVGRALEAFMQRCRTFISDGVIPGMAAPLGLPRIS